MSTRVPPSSSSTANVRRSPSDNSVPSERSSIRSARREEFYPLERISSRPTRLSALQLLSPLWIQSKASGQGKIFKEWLRKQFYIRDSLYPIS
jgi:hypothetical protein